MTDPLADLWDGHGRLSPDTWYEDLANWWDTMDPKPLKVKRTGLAVIIPDRHLVMRQLETLGGVPRAQLAFEVMDGVIPSLDHVPLLKQLIPILEGRAYWVSFQRKHPDHPSRLFITPNLKTWFDSDLDVESLRKVAPW